MTQAVLFGTWNKALTDALKTLSWAVTVDEYPYTVTKLETPCIFIDVPGWKNMEVSDGQVNVMIECDLYVVVDKSTDSADKPEVYARALAMDLSQWVEGSDFGIDDAYDATFIDAVRTDFDPRLDDYIVMRVSFSQQLPIGAPLFADPEGNPLKRIYLGVDPNIGADHVNDYRLIYEAQPDE